MSNDEGQDLDESRVPELSKTAFDCPRCGAFASQSWGVLRRAGQAQFDDARHTYGRWTSAQCARCGEFSVWREQRMVFPRSGLAPVAHAQMPVEAKELYDEAREIVGISRRAGAALARAALERLLRTLDPEAGTKSLAARIDRILPRVPGPLGQMLTVIRVAGNSTLHMDDEPDEILVLILDPAETEIVELIFEAINDLVEELIAKPSKVAKLYEKIPESIRGRVEKALGQSGPTA